MLGFDSRLEYCDALRAEPELLVAAYLAAGETITQCRAETTAAMLKKRKPGRPPEDGVRAKSNAERQKKKYWLDKERKRRLELEEAHELLQQQQERLQEKLRIVTASAPPPPGENMSELERENIDSILADWIEAAVMPSAKQRDEFREFLDSAAFYGLRMPDVGGDQVALYLLAMWPTARRCLMSSGQQTR